MTTTAHLPRRTFGIAACLVASLGLLGAGPARAQTSGASADSQILKWKDGKKACFMLGFDDSAASQLKNVVPELQRRKILGNFYLVTGNKLYESLRPKWEEAAKSPFVSVANHTFTHKGAVDPTELDAELAKCNEVLYALHPERKQPYLLGFGKPGGVPWVVTKEEVEAALKKHHLVDRPPFAGPPINYKSAAETVGAVDKVLASGDMVQLVFHGVGGDWLVTPVEWFTALLDKLEASRAQLWITDVVSWHQYVRQRQSAEIKVLQSDKNRVRLSLTSSLDPALYNLPVTLSTKVPASWKECVVTQGTSKVNVSAQSGAVQYDAVPGAGEILIQPVKPGP